MLCDFLRLIWEISFLDRRLCGLLSVFSFFFFPHRKASQTPAGRSRSRSNQAGLYYVPLNLLDYFLNIFHFIPPVLSSVLSFTLSFLVCYFVVFFFSRPFI